MSFYFSSWNDAQRCNYSRRIAVKQHKTSKKPQNDHNVHFKVKVNCCLMSNISKRKPFMAIVTI